MKKQSLTLLVFLIVLFACASQALGQTAETGYKAVEVATFDIKPETKFPESSRDVMMTEIVDELTKTKRFTSVKLAAAPGEGPTDASTIRITGSVTQYIEGNRTARYLIGFGAGRAKLKAHIQVTDSTGKLIFEKDVDGNVVMGAFGGNSNDITRGLAKEIAKDITKRLPR